MKKIDKDINKVFYEDIARPLRKKKDFIILLLETVKLFYIETTYAESYGKVTIIIDKMSRVFYGVENKMFSIVFPFGVEKDGEGYRIYDTSLDFEIDSRIISVMISILNRYELHGISGEEIFDAYCESMQEDENEILVESAWKVLLRLQSVELGYIRYDYDEKNQDEKLHPLNHFDINYSTNVTYKIGLRKKIEMEYFISFVDVKKECVYLC